MPVNMPTARMSQAEPGFLLVIMTMYVVLEPLVLSEWQAEMSSRGTLMPVFFLMALTHVSWGFSNLLVLVTLSRTYKGSRRLGLGPESGEDIIFPFILLFLTSAHSFSIMSILALRALTSSWLAFFSTTFWVNLIMAP